MLEGWNSASTLQSSLGSQQGSNNALQSSSSNSSYDSMKSQEANSWQETAVALKKVCTNVVQCTLVAEGANSQGFRIPFSLSRLSDSS